MTVLLEFFSEERCAAALAQVKGSVENANARNALVRAWGSLPAGWDA